MSGLGYLVPIGFGLVALSSLFLVFIFWRAWEDTNLRHDSRYRTVSGALAIGKVGIFLWAINPISVALGGAYLPTAVLVLASALLLIAAVTLIGSTALGGDRATLKIFLVCSAIWILLCLFVEWRGV